MIDIFHEYGLAQCIDLQFGRSYILSKCLLLTIACRYRFPGKAFPESNACPKNPCVGKGMFSKSRERAWTAEAIHIEDGPDGTYSSTV